MRVVWSVVAVVVVVALIAWGTTCTGPRPKPTGDTLPAGSSTTVVPEAAGDAVIAG